MDTLEPIRDTKPLCVLHPLPGAIALMGIPSDLGRSTARHIGLNLREGTLMTSTQAKEFADFLDALRARFSNPDLDSATVRDIVETMHLATKEPEGVSYAEEDAGAVEALWCIPADSDPEAVLLPMFGDTFPPKA